MFLRFSGILFSAKVCTSICIKETIGTPIFCDKFLSPERSTKEASATILPPSFFIKSKVSKENNKRNRRSEELSRRTKNNDNSDSNDSDWIESDSDMDSHEYRKFLSKLYPSKNLDKNYKI